MATGSTPTLPGLSLSHPLSTSGGGNRCLCLLLALPGDPTASES